MTDNPTTYLTMTLDICLVAHVQPKLVAKLVPPPVVRIVTVSYGVEVEPGGKIKSKETTPTPLENIKGGNPYVPYVVILGDVVTFAHIITQFE